MWGTITKSYLWQNLSLESQEKIQNQWEGFSEDKKQEIFSIFEETDTAQKLIVEIFEDELKPKTAEYSKKIRTSAEEDERENAQKKLEFLLSNL
ncbi:MAG: hypothetical protein WCJ84_01175 [Candidatus Peregrinibacteria bacterium]